MGLVLSWRAPTVRPALASAQVFLVSGGGDGAQTPPDVPSPASRPGSGPPPSPTPPQPDPARSAPEGLAASVVQPLNPIAPAEDLETLSPDVPPNSQPPDASARPLVGALASAAPDSAPMSVAEAVAEAAPGAPQKVAQLVAAETLRKGQPVALHGALPGAVPGALPALASGGGAKTCQILEALQSTLRTSAPVRRALSLIPRQARSVANAVMVWDGRWRDEGALGGAAAVGPLQAAVLLTVSQAPAPCQADLVIGPRLITIGDDRDTLVLAFGSGQWRWADLLSISPPNAPLLSSP